MRFVKTVFVLTILLACNLALSAAIPASERQALIDLYNSTDGDHWNFPTSGSSWKLAGEFRAPGTENTWSGVAIDAGNTTVHGLSLSWCL